MQENRIDPQSLTDNTAIQVRLCVNSVPHEWHDITETEFQKALDHAHHPEAFLRDFLGTYKYMRIGLTEFRIKEVHDESIV